MGRVARQMVEQTGLDVNVLIDKLVAAAGARFMTFYPVREQAGWV
jgi:ferritin-like protein